MTIQNPAGRVLMGKNIKKVRHNIKAGIEGKNRGDATREKILASARRVFARHAFHAASIRMIAQEGNFPHGDIRYHFPNKAFLFEETAKEACEDFFQQNIQWLKEIAGSPLEMSLSVYMDKLLAYNEEKPWALQMINQNLAQADRPENTPGYGHILEMLNRARLVFRQSLPEKASEDLINRFYDAFNGLIIHFLGASSCQAQVLGLDPRSREYAEWVKRTMGVVFLPLLKEILFHKPADSKPDAAEKRSI